MKFKQSGTGIAGPSSTLGIMRFFDTEVGGPKLAPEFIIGITIAFTLLIVFLKFAA